MKLEHLALNIPDPSATAKWYEQHLAMRVLRSTDASPFIHFLVDSSGSSVLEFYHNSRVAIPDYSALDPINLHLAFSVEDIDSARDRLIAAGAVPSGEMTVTEAGDRLLFLRDPWGIPLQLVMRKSPLVPDSIANKSSHRPE